MDSVLTTLESMLSSESHDIVHHVIWNGHVLFVQCISTCVMVIPHRINISEGDELPNFHVYYISGSKPNQNPTQIWISFFGSEYQIFNIDACLQIGPKILHIDDRNHFGPIRGTFFERLN